MCDAPSKIYCIRCNEKVFSGNLTGRKIDKDTLEADGCFIKYNSDFSDLIGGCLSSK